MHSKAQVFSGKDWFSVQTTPTFETQDGDPPLLEALAHLPALLAPFQIIFGESITNHWKKEGEDDQKTCFEDLRGILLWDRYAERSAGASSRGVYTGTRLYVLSRGEYILVARKGSWSCRPRLNFWTADFKELRTSELSVLAGREQEMKALFMSLNRRFWEYAHRHPYESQTRSIEKLACWLGNCAAGRVAAL